MWYMPPMMPLPAAWPALPAGSWLAILGAGTLVALVGVALRAWSAGPSGVETQGRPRARPLSPAGRPPARRAA